MLGEFSTNGPQFTIDDQVSTTFISAISGYPHGWLEISLTQPVYVAGLEFSVMETNNAKFRQILVSGGATTSPWNQDEGGDSKDTHHTRIGKYTGPAGNGEIVYFPFIDFKFLQHIMLQFDTSGNYFELAELRVIKAKFDECPNRGRKVASPEGASTHSSVVDWADCSLKCSISLTCTFWQWEISSGTCTTVTGTGDGTLDVDDGFVVGKRGCHSYMETSGWKTCTDTQLNNIQAVCPLYL